MEPLKNMFNEEFVLTLSNNIYKHEKSFLKDKYEQQVFDSLNNLELKERMRVISSCLHECLALPYKEKIDVLIKAKNEFSSQENLELTSMVFPDYVEVYGLDDYDTSIKALEEFTINSSSEFAIRHLILKYEDETMNQMLKWTKSENEHIRRLASEGCRPRLPWAIALPRFKKNPNKVLEVLELLKNDESLYVRRSVANNLNDIAKDNPSLVIDFVSKNIGKNKNLDWLCKHASRTLLKKGDKDILLLFDYKPCSHVNIINLQYDENLKIGDNFKFSFDLESQESIGNLRLEYAIYYKKANGTNSKKVFMISQNEIFDKNRSFSKKQSFKNMTTRKHHTGEHFISIILNGEEKIKRSFILDDTCD